jgi:formate/nitrite transporter FocA (FNT family)
LDNPAQVSLRSPQVEPERQGSPPEAEPSGGTRLSATEIHENVLESGKEEMRRPSAELFWSALAAGLAIGFGFLGGAYLTTFFPARFHPLVVTLAYPLGFIFVVQGRSQLFTENTLQPVIPLLVERSRKAVVSLLRIWGIVLIGNLIGAAIFAWVLARSPMLDEPLRSAVAPVAYEGTKGTFGFVFYRALFGGWLIALMAWLLASTKSAPAQIVYIVLATAPISAFAFRHSIAGAAEAFYLALVGEATLVWAISGFLIPALLGNVLGGVILVALLNHAQAGRGEGKKNWLARD